MFHICHIYFPPEKLIKIKTFFTFESRINYPYFTLYELKPSWSRLNWKFENNLRVCWKRTHLSQTSTKFTKQTFFLYLKICRNGTTWICDGILPSMAEFEILGYHRIAFGSQMCWCTIGEYFTNIFCIIY